MPHQNEQNIEKQNVEDESFEKLLEQSLQPQIQLAIGDMVEGEIVFISDDAIFVNIFGKSEALIDKSEFFDSAGKLSIHKGDKLSAYVVSTSGGEIRLTSAIGKSAVTPELLKIAFRNQIPVFGTVTSQQKAGFSVSISGIHCFCPTSQIDRRISDNAHDYLHKTFQFLIIDYSDRGRNIIVSRKALLDKRYEERLKELSSTVKIGNTIAGTITGIEKHGIIVDLDGVEAFIPKKEVSWSRNPDVNRYHVGERITAKIIKFDDGNIILSHREVLPEPWSHIDDFCEGQHVNGKVVHLIKSGAFVEIADGLEGFIPLNRMSIVKKINKPEEILQLNDVVLVKILEIKKSEKKILLELITNEPDPWQTIDSSFYQAIHSAIIESSRPNGIMVRLENGMEGFIPKNELLKNRGDLPSVYPTGLSLQVAVKECIPEERKLVLSEKGAITLQESQEFRMYQNAHQQNSTSTTLGNIFKERFTEIQNKIKQNKTNDSI